MFLYGVNGLGFRVLGFRVLGFRGSGVWGVGLKTSEQRGYKGSCRHHFLRMGVYMVRSKIGFKAQGF